MAESAEKGKGIGNGLSPLSMGHGIADTKRMQ
jgi:hypothetical protein